MKKVIVLGYGSLDHSYLLRVNGKLLADFMRAAEARGEMASGEIRRLMVEYVKMQEIEACE